MDRNELYRIADDAVNDQELRSCEIPMIDLYVDQIINLVSDKLKAGSPRYHDRQLTKTMINNYSKDGLITPVKGKKYNKEQIVQMLTVYSLKNTLSIGEIKRMLDGAYSCEGFDGAALIEFYERYMDIKEKNRTFTHDAVRSMIDRDGLDPEDDTELMLIITSLLSMSAFLRHTAQAIIDEKYPAPIEEDEKEKKEKDKDKEKDKEKEKNKKEKKKKADAEPESEGETELI